jgi:hypothetical protein
MDTPGKVIGASVSGAINPYTGLVTVTIGSGVALRFVARCFPFARLRFSGNGGHHV